VLRLWARFGPLLGLTGSYTLLQEHYIRRKHCTVAQRRDPCTVHLDIFFRIPRPSKWAFTKVLLSEDSNIL